MRIIAHRCGTDRFTELTIASAENSLAAGALYVELDVRFTKDGGPVVNHDSGGSFLFGCDMPVRDMTLEKFLSLRHKADPRYSSCALEHFFRCGIRRMLLHIKEGGNRLPAILEMCRAYGCEDSVVLGVSSLEDAGIVRDFNPAIRILGFIPKVSDLDAFLARDLYALRLWEQDAADERIRLVTSTKTKLWIMARKGDVGYTDEANLPLWRDKGVDAVLLNNVERALLLLGKK